MRTPLVTSQQMRLISQIAQLRSIKLAAAELGISASLASRHLMSLESELKVRLFKRTTRHLEPSEAGQILIDWATSALENLELAVEDLQGVTHEARGHVRLACPELLAVRFIANVLPSFARKYPGIKVEVVTHEQTTLALEGHFDAAIHVGAPPKGNMIIRRILDVGVILCAARSYLDWRGSPVTPEDLQQHTLLSHKIYDQHRWTFHKQGRRIVFNFEPSFESNSTLLLLELALKGTGVTCLSQRTAAEHLRSGALVRVLADYLVRPAKAQEMDVWLVLPHRNVPSRTRLLIDEIVRHLKEFG